MREPRIFNTGSVFKLWEDGVYARLKNGRLVPARPLTMERWIFSWRMLLAWRVFTGRYDALLWECEEEK